MRAQELLGRLVAYDTVSERSNVELVEYLAGHARSLGFEIKIDTVNDARGVAKANLICQLGPARDARAASGGLAFVGHTDTVPYDPEWKEALTLIERDGKLYARGAADTKGFIAAVLTAVESADLNRLSRPLFLVFTHDEEIGCLGAKRLAKEI